MSSYLNLTTGECISGTCQSVIGLQQHNPAGLVIISLLVGIILLIGAIYIELKDLEEKQ